MQGIALIGEPGSGKTTIALSLANKLGWKKTAFADPLREEAAFALAMVSNKPQLQYVSEMLDPKTKDNYRLLLQWWGTEFRRAQDPEYWITVMKRQLLADGAYVIDDCRFNNEYELLRGLGFKFVYLSPGETTREILAHPSEVDWKNWEVDLSLSYELGPTHQADRLITALGLEPVATTN